MYITNHVDYGKGRWFHHPNNCSSVLSWWYCSPKKWFFQTTALFGQCMLRKLLLCVMADLEMCMWKESELHWQASLLTWLIQWILRIALTTLLDRKESMSLQIMATLYAVKYGGWWGTLVHEHWLLYLVYLNVNVLICDFDIWVLKDTFAFGINDYQICIITYVVVSIHGGWLKT